MLENVGKIMWLKVAGNRRDKFIEWLTKVCPEYKLWHDSEEWLCRHFRYRKYHDCVRYPPEKFLKVMNKCLPVYIEFKMTSEFLLAVDLSIYNSKSMGHEVKIMKFFENNFNANISLYWAAGNLNLKNLIIGHSEYETKSVINMKLMINTMKG